MAIKHICDNCQSELNNRFYCEVLMREIKVISNLAPNSKGYQAQPQLQEKRWHLCEKCFEDKLKDLTTKNK